MCQRLRCLHRLQPLTEVEAHRAQRLVLIPHRFAHAPWGLQHRQVVEQQRQHLVNLCVPCITITLARQRPVLLHHRLAHAAGAMAAPPGSQQQHRHVADFGMHCIVSNKTATVLALLSRLQATQTNW